MPAPLVLAFPDEFSKSKKITNPRCCLNNQAPTLRRVNSRAGWRLWFTLVSCLAWLMLTAPAPAVNYTWTNTTTGTWGYWTNGILWNVSGDYPGSNTAFQGAFFTNNSSVAGGSYTNVLNLGPAAFVGMMVLSNGNSGQAWLVITNAAGSGTVQLNVTNLTLGSGADLVLGAATGGSSILSNTGLLNWYGSNGVIYLNNGGQFITTNAIIIGSGISNVTATVATQSGAGNAGVWNLGGQNLTVGTGAATGDVLAVNGGIISNVGVVSLGVNTLGNSITISNGGQFISGQVSIGTVGASGSNNLYAVGGLGSVSTVSNNFVTIGAAGNANTMTVTNANLWVGGLTIGNAGGSNLVNVLSNATLTVSNTELQLGYSGLGANLWNINGGVVSNVASIEIGRGATVLGNSVTVSNGGQLLGGNVYIGYNGGASNNIFNVGGFGAISTVSNGQVVVGNNANGAGGGNSLNVTNANFTTSGGITVGSGASNNVVTVSSNANWNLLSQSLTIGSGQATGNVMTITAGGTVTNVGVLNVGGASTGSGTLTLSGGNLFVQSLLVTNTLNGGPTNSVFNFSGGTLTTSNAAGQTASLIKLGATTFTVNSTWNMLGGVNTISNVGGVASTFTIGNGVSNALVAVASNAVWNLGAMALTIGNGAATGDLLLVNGGTVTNAGNVIIGGLATSFRNGIWVSNGANFFSGNVTLGNAAGASSNYYNVGSLGSGSTVSNGAITVGNTGAGFNTMTVTNATVLSGALNVGSSSSNNSVTIQAGTTWNLLNNSINVGTGGGQGTGNMMTVDGGGVAGGVVITNVNTLNVGNPTLNGGIQSGNQFILTNGANLYIVGVAGNQGIAVGALPGGQGNDVTSNNLFKVDGGVAGSVISNAGSFTIGTSVGTSSSNQVILANATMVNMQGMTLQGSNDVFSVLGGATVGFAGGAQAITVLGTSNLLLVNGGVVTNVGKLVVSGFADSLIITNGGNFTLVTGNGNGSSIAGSNNTLKVTGGSTFNDQVVSATTFFIGTAGGIDFNNQLLLDNGTFTANQIITVGSAGAGQVSNALIVLNGSQFVNGNPINVGVNANSSNNYFTVGGGAAAVTVSNNGLVTIGGSGGGFNTMTVTHASLWTSGLTVGSGSSNNVVSVLKM